MFTGVIPLCLVDLELHYIVACLNPRAIQRGSSPLGAGKSATGLPLPSRPPIKKAAKRSLDSAKQPGILARLARAKRYLQSPGKLAPRPEDMVRMTMKESKARGFAAWGGQNVVKRVT